ncbi:leucine--tRNA ligase [Apibacter adventoris]|uniref:Leucine--tRNA ligase n=1 Tax=Apibacter adventoris TaxID=1679466 RepID=A0A2S8A877_9FLAO|nr:class I tRNA ligase family protein [Apibacter adventoris]PQL90763.1 leucine--tRNA ligase [Apibacter adventoris]
MQYNFQEIEKKWQKIWEDQQTFAASTDTSKPKYYVLDMFPYPSGAGLHVGHPLGYIASDIYARFKRHQGFNVLHPMGYDSFGLPAEQYAIQTGQHPATTTQVNIEGGIDKQGNAIAGYENQLKKLGFSYDWNREVRTSNPDFYHWTQWLFIQLYHSYYNNDKQQAYPISELVEIFQKEGNSNIQAATSQKEIFSADDWNGLTEEKKQEILLNYRLTYRAETTVNWCPALGTVLANDEVVNGVSERGGHPVYQQKMMQWSMRITAYAERLLQGLETIDWSEAIKESQRNWIGKSKGAEIDFSLSNSNITIKVFTTRPDTIYGVTFMVLAPEHPLVDEITTGEYIEKVNQYKEDSSKRSERDRMADAKTVSGQFTGAYAINPFSKEKIPVYIADYVLMGYGTGAIMAVPAHDERDHRFASYFSLSIKEVIQGGENVQNEAYVTKEGICINSGIIEGLSVKEAQEKIISEVETQNIGKGTINYRLRDAVFSRQRYWGEPIPIYYKNNIPYTLPESSLPLILPKVEKYLPTEDGEPPLGRAKEWAWNEKEQKIVSKDLINDQTVFPLELNTMPGWAGSSWYYLRYADPKNNTRFADDTQVKYWENVDLYIGGSEHATGHLLYSRFWNKFLKDYGYVNSEEPFQKLINQGMIQGIIENCYRSINSGNFIYKGKKMINIFNDNEELGVIIFDKNCFSNHIFEFTKEYQTLAIPIEFVKNYNKSDKEAYLDEENIHQYVKWHNFKNPVFITQNGFYKYSEKKFYNLDGQPLPPSTFKFYTESELGKMSKSKYNVINPDDVCEEYGADTLRMYEMFLGPIDQAKPWNTQGLTGVHSFLKKLWRLYFSGENEAFSVSEEKATKEELKTLHQLIKKVTEDIQNFSFNTSISSFMIAVNELAKLKTDKREILEPLIVLLSPYAPHIAEELWEKLGHTESIEKIPFPEFHAEYLVSDSFEYPVSFNGKVRFKIEMPAAATPKEVEEAVMAHEKTPNYLEGKTPKKIIVVPKRIINIVI